MMLTHSYSWEATLADSLKVVWNVNDLIGADKRLDFSRPFLPESLAGVRGLSSLSEREKLLLNQIRGNGYLFMFQITEEFVIPFMLDQVRKVTPGGDAHEVRAMLTFAEEEMKHIQLFQRFAEEFAAGFRTPCTVVGPIKDIANAILKHSDIGLTILALHLEWMTQLHYLDSIKDDQNLDLQFKNLLRNHWMEEAQHVKTDTLLLEKLVREGGPQAVAQGFADFAAIGGMVDGLLQQQVQFDLDALQAASGRKLGTSERQDVATAQLRAHRYAFLVSGLLQKNFQATVEQLSPEAAASIRGMASALSA